MKNQKKKLNSIISEVLKSTTKTCSCGCNTCNIPPTLTEGKVETSKLLSNQITNKQPLHETPLNSGSKEFFNLWKEARKLYSRELLDVGSTDEKILKETKLGEFGNFRGKAVPLDYPTDGYIFTLNESKQVIKQKLSKDHILNKLSK